MTMNELTMIPRSHFPGPVLLLGRIGLISGEGHDKNLSPERSDTQLAAILTREELAIAKETV